MRFRLLTATLAAAMLAATLSCVNLPEPEGPDNALVIGSFVVDFPEGCFGGAIRSFRSGVKIHFANLRTKKTFFVTTDQGYFCFLSNGEDQYALVGYEMKYNETGSQGRFGDRVMKRLPVAPGKVIYLGSFVATWTNARKSTRQSLGQAMTYWEYDRALGHSWEDGLLEEYLESRGPESGWRQREVLRQASYDIES